MLRTARTRRRAILAAATGAALAAGMTAAQAASTTSPSAPAPTKVGRVLASKAHPLFMWTVGKQWNHPAQGSLLTPPAPPCPESGKLPQPFSNCGLPEFPATGEPYPGNMAYWGGHVQVDPKVYLVYWGWGQPKAFSAKCAPEPIVEGRIRVTLKCDPDRTGKLMADFVSQLGGTHWAGLQTQYYETVGGRTRYITNPKDQLGGIWVDDSSHLDTTKYTPSSSPVGIGVPLPGQSADDGGRIYRQMAMEAARAVAHFHIRDLADANIVIAQPQNYSDPAAASVGYCAFHDYTEPVLENGWYNGITPGISYTNMPYVYSQGAGCGAGMVNSGVRGKSDGVTLALGHEIEETVTDPAAEDILPNGTVLGGWFDPFDANENGDKCAYVGLLAPQPGSAANIRGNRGGLFAVQSLWSNEAAEGVGYCAGAGTDVPLPNG